MKKIHLVIDAQNDFITGSLKNDEANKKVDNIVKALKSREYDEPVYFTMDTHGNDYMSTFEGKNLPIPHCIKYTAGWQIDDRLAEFVSDDKIIMKYTFGTFDFKKIIGVSDAEFHVYGFCTDICVVSNVLILRAQYPDNRIVVHADCCAGTTAENHEAALKVMKSCQIEAIV